MLHLIFLTKSFVNILFPSNLSSQNILFPFHLICWTVSSFVLFLTSATQVKFLFYPSLLSFKLKKIEKIEKIEKNEKNRSGSFSRWILINKMANMLHICLLCMYVLQKKLKWDFKNLYAKECSSTGAQYLLH